MKALGKFFLTPFVWLFGAVLLFGLAIFVGGGYIHYQLLHLYEMMEED